MKNAFLATALAFSVCLSLTTAAHADSVKAVATKDSTGEYKEFKLASMDLGDCKMEEGSSVKYYGDGHMRFSAVLNCKNAYDYDEWPHHRAFANNRTMPYNSWDGDMEMEASFYGIDGHHFNVEFDSDLGVHSLESLGADSTGYRYRWTETLPPGYGRSRHYAYVDQMYTRMD